MEQNITPMNKKEGKTMTKQVRLSEDGKYQWYYEFNMWRNPSIIFLVCKIFFFILLGMWIFFSIIFLIQGEGWDSVLFMGKLTLVVGGIFAVLIPMGYGLLALIYGGKYMVNFEMDEEGILHEQIASQSKKSKIIGWLTVLVGLMGRSPSAMGAGMLSTANSSSYSTFANVKSVKAYPERNLIKVNEALFKNQVYVEDPKDFEFVYRFIVEHCPKAR